MNFRRLFGVYLLLLALSLASTRFLPPPPLALSSAVQPVTRLGVQAGQNVRRFLESIAFERDLGRRYIELRKTAQSLENRNRILERELERLKKAAGIRVSSSPNIITVAPVVGLDPSPLLSRLTLGQGAEQGITRFMSATVPEGVVGQVVEVNRVSSVVLTLVDPDSKIGVALEGKKGRGLAVGTPPDRLRAEFPKNVKVTVGDTVLTANFGGVFPSSLKVGVVDSILPLGPNSVTRVVFVRPAVDFENLEDVAILQAL